MTNSIARFMITTLWVLSFLLPIPWLLYFDLVPVFKNDTTLFCLERWPYWLNGNLYFLIVNVILGYIIPLILISICYVLIYMKVWKRDIPTDSKSAQMERMQQKSKYKVLSYFKIQQYFSYTLCTGKHKVFINQIDREFHFQTKECYRFMKVMTPLLLTSNMSECTPMRDDRRGFIFVALEGKTEYQNDQIVGLRTSKKSGITLTL